MLDSDGATLGQGCILIWVLWEARNSVLFPGSSMNVCEVILLASALASDYKEPPSHSSLMFPSIVGLDGSNSRVQVHWTHLLVGWLQ